MDRGFKVGDKCIDWEGDRCEVVEVHPEMIKLRSLEERNQGMVYLVSTNRVDWTDDTLRHETSTADQTFHKDAGKPDPTLIPSNALMQVVSVFEHGLEKGYQPRSWRKVPDAQARYLKSLARHFQAVLKAYQDGEEGGVMVLDSDGGRPHLAAIAADALILLDLALRGEGK